MDEETYRRLLWELREQINTLFSANHLLTTLVRERGVQRDLDCLAMSDQALYRLMRTIQHLEFVHGSTPILQSQLIDVAQPCRRLGESLERLWGSTKFTVYYLSGTLLSALAVLLVYFIDKIPVPLASAGYVNTALFMAYALTYPDAMVRIYFILPVKMKWLAILEAALYVFSVISAAAAGLWGMALLPIVAMLNLFVFFSPDFSRRADQFQARHRSEAVQFRKAVKEQKRQRGYNHKCEVCGRTDTDFPDLQFRYCSKCTGYHCFCEEHIFNHIHHRE